MIWTSTASYALSCSPRLSSCRRLGPPLDGFQRCCGVVAGHALPPQAGTPAPWHRPAQRLRAHAGDRQRRRPVRRRVPRACPARAVPGLGVEPHRSPDGRATHALCSDVLEHLDDPGVLLRHAAAYMAPGCQLVVTVPGGWRSAFYSHIGHRRHYTPAQLRGLLESAGFAVERAYAAGFPFFNLYRMLVTLRGQELVAEAARGPTLLMRAAGAIFEALFRLNLMHPWGWQTLAVTRYRGP